MANLDDLWMRTTGDRQGWIRQADQGAHQCPTPDPNTAHLDDLWRCQCATLWRVGRACGACEVQGRAYPHGGQHRDGHRWLPAGWWARWRHRNTPAKETA